jgi:hypothetical protein
VSVDSPEVSISPQAALGVSAVITNNSEM